MYCANCGTQNPDDAKFCCKCGASTESLTEPITGFAITQPQETEPEPVPSPEMKHYCPNCGNTQKEEGFCGMCGTRLIYGMPIQPTQPKSSWLSTHKQKILGILPYIGSGAMGIASVVLIISFISTTVSNGKVLSAYNAERAEHDALVREAEAVISDLENKEADTRAEIEACTEKASSLKAENDTYALQKAELENKIEKLQAEKDELLVQSFPFAGVDPDYTVSDNYEEKIVEVINEQQQDIYSMKSKIALNISSVLENDGFSYTIPEPVNIPKEFAKEIIGGIAGEIGSTAFDAAADIASDMIDGNDLNTAVANKIHDEINSHIESYKTSALDAATGGAYSKITDALDVVGNIQDLYNKLTDTTPQYVAAALCGEAQPYIERLCEFIDNENPSADEIFAAAEDFRWLIIIADSIYELQGDIKVGGVTKKAKSQIDFLNGEVSSVDYYCSNIIYADYIIANYVLLSEKEQ